MLMIIVVVFCFSSTLEALLSEEALSPAPTVASTTHRTATSSHTPTFPPISLNPSRSSNPTPAKSFYPTKSPSNSPYQSHYPSLKLTVLPIRDPIKDCFAPILPPLFSNPSITFLNIDGINTTTIITQAGKTVTAQLHYGWNMRVIDQHVFLFAGFIGDQATCARDMAPNVMGSSVPITFSKRVVQGCNWIFSSFKAPAVPPTRSCLDFAVFDGTIIGAVWATAGPTVQPTSSKPSQPTRTPTLTPSFSSTKQHAAVHK